MKTLLLTLLLSLSLLFVKAQAYMELDINNVKAAVMPIGMIFNDLNGAKFIVPKPAPGQLAKSTIYGAAPWIGGIANGQLHLAAETYRQNGNDLQFGPISSDTSQDYLMRWNRLWKITRVELDTFIARVKNGDDVSSFYNILDWPAKGNVYGDDIEMNDYAPFRDVDSNGTYDPYAGDYPLIKGDQCIYAIMNDNIPHTESLGQPLKVDIHRMVYAYAGNHAINHTVFVDYKIVNKSGTAYDDFIFSSWVDFDIGNYIDDYVGTDTLRNMVYGLNGDNNDETISGYGANPPAEACVLLNAQIGSSMYYNNDFDTKTGNPLNANHYYNYMKGKWLDGTPKTAAGNGYNTIGAVTNYSYSGDPCNNTGWWEGSAHITQGDRRIVASTVPQLLPQNGEVNISMAFVYARGTTNLNSICELKGAVDTVINWYNSATGIQKINKQLSFSIFPNPAHTSFTIQGAEINDAVVSIVDITGKVLNTYTLTNSHSVQIDDLSPGLYLVKITTEKGSATKRLLIE